MSILPECIIKCGGETTYISFAIRTYVCTYRYPYIWSLRLHTKRITYRKSKLLYTYINYFTHISIMSIYKLRVRIYIWWRVSTHSTATLANAVVSSLTTFPLFLSFPFFFRFLSLSYDIPKHKKRRRKRSKKKRLYMCYVCGWLVSASTLFSHSYANVNCRKFRCYMCVYVCEW